MRQGCPDWPSDCFPSTRIKRDSEHSRQRFYLEGYAKLSLKKYRPIAARKDDEKVFNGLL